MKIGIIGAMELELENFKNFFDINTIETIVQNEFYTVTYHSVELIIVCSGQGKTNSTLYTQLLIERFSPALIINLGICGGINESLEIFDICIGAKYCHYDVRKRQSLGKFPNRLYYEGSRGEIETFLRIDPSLQVKTFGTGEGFIADRQTAQKLEHEFEIDCVDMESASIAQCCYLNGTKFISIRVVSDYADSNAVLVTEDEQEKAMNKVFLLLLKYLDFRGKRKLK